MSTINEVPNYKQNLQQLREQLPTIIPADKFQIFDNDAQQLADKYVSPLKLHQGDTAAQFSLPNANGKIVSLAEMLQQGAVVLTFYRGSWCPYCNLQLKNYQQILPQINNAGANLIAISPMAADHSLTIKQTNQLEFEVLSDVGSKVATYYTSVFKNSDAPVQAMSDMGYDFLSFYDDDSAQLPVPATFVIAKDGTILFASSVGGDYRERVEPQAILDALLVSK